MSTYLTKRLAPSGQTYYQTVHYDAPTVLRKEGNNLILSFEYDARLVEAIKTLPRAVRRYRPATRDWIINGVYGARVIRLVKEAVGEDISAREEAKNDEH